VFHSASDADLGRPMLETVGWPLVATVSMAMEDGDAKHARVALCMEGLRLGIHLSLLMGLDTLRYAFLTSLVRWAQRHLLTHPQAWQPAWLWLYLLASSSSFSSTLVPPALHGGTGAPHCTTPALLFLWGSSSGTAFFKDSSSGYRFSCKDSSSGTAFLVRILPLVP